jgi:transcriptional repressor NrdR
MYCGCADSKVIDSRATDDNNSIRRRRECLNCGKRFTTYETIEITPVMVVKNDGTREPFDAAKVKRGIVKSCEKRPVSMAQIDAIVADIEKQVANSLDQEISSIGIGEMVMRQLKDLDEVSYVRFASVYKQFKDMSTFMEFIEEFEHRLKKTKE